MAIHKELQRPSLCRSQAANRPASEETARDDGCPRSILSNVGETIAAEGAAETVNVAAEIAAAAGGCAKELELENTNAETIGAIGVDSAGSN